MENRRVNAFAAFAIAISVFSAGNRTALAQEVGTSSASDSHDAVTVDPIVEKVDEAIRITSRRFLTADHHTPWQVMHGILALRHDFQLRRKDGKGFVRALDWVAGGASYRGEPLFQTTIYGGKSHPYTEDYIFEGHPNQFLAIMCMSDLPLDYKFKAGHRTITIKDMVKNAQMEVNDIEEVTWSLWALSHYLPPDARWVNNRGQHWSIERLVQVQSRATIEKSACGGTHALFAMSYARNRCREEGLSERGAWFEASQKIERYIAATKSLQNRDGTFSSEYFKGPGFSREFEKRIATTGHILEWLMIALSDKRLQEDWVQRAIEAVADDMIENRTQPADCGPLYHALDALVIYKERVSPAESAGTVTQINDPKLPGSSKVAGSDDTESATK